MTWIDLHLHSSCSDGADAPDQVAARAAACGAAAIALTDHDTTAGLARARTAADALGLGFLEGVEISAAHQDRELHVVGLGVAPEAESLRALLDALGDMRRRRASKIVERLHRVGVHLDPPEPTPDQEQTPPGRMHVAVALQRMGAAATVQGAFDRYLNRGCPAHVPKQLPPVAQAIDAIHDAGGLAFLAHPGLGRRLLRHLPALLEFPFDGIEAWHPSHTPEITQECVHAAQARGLLLSGGSDCHGGVKGEPPALGRVKVDYRHYEKIAEALAEKAALRREQRPGEFRC